MILPGNNNGMYRSNFLCSIIFCYCQKQDSRSTFTTNYYSVCHSISKNLIHLEIVLKEILFGTFWSQTN